MCRSLLFLFGALLMMSTSLAAQQPEPSVMLGAIRVPACQTAGDPEYGLVANKAVAIGGGPVFMAARQRRYLNALHGPQGQAVTIGNRGSAPLPGDPEHAIIDSYHVSYEVDGKPVEKTIYLDAYHYDAPKAPAGFTCGAPLASVAGIPPADPIKASAAVVALAIEQGSKADVAPIKLDPSSPRGYLFDRFDLIALQARAAANSGTPLDPARLPKEIETIGQAVLAYPVSCGDRTIPATNVELIGAQGPIARDASGGVVQGEALARAFPDVPTPAGSIGIRFRNVQPTQAKITYAEGCNGSPAETTVPFRSEPPRLLEFVPGVMPAGVVEAEPVVYIQVLIDPDGHIARPQYLGGPRSLYSAAVDALAKRRVQPIRVNGSGVVTPNVVQVRKRSTNPVLIGSHRSGTLAFRRDGQAAARQPMVAAQPLGVSSPMRWGCVATRRRTSLRYSNGGRWMSAQLWTSE